MKNEREVVRPSHKKIQLDLHVSISNKGNRVLMKVSKSTHSSHSYQTIMKRLKEAYRTEDYILQNV